MEILCDRQSVLRVVAGLRLIGRHGNERLVFAAHHYLNVLYHKTAVYCDMSRSFKVVVIHGSKLDVQGRSGLFGSGDFGFKRFFGRTHKLLVAFQNGIIERRPRFCGNGKGYICVISAHLLAGQSYKRTLFALHDLYSPDCQLAVDYHVCDSLDIAAVLDF